MSVVILCLFAASVVCLLASGVTVVIKITNANRSKILGEELRDYWQVKAITLPCGSEIIHSPRARTPDEQRTLDGRLTEWRTANERVRFCHKLAGELCLMGCCLLGVGLLYMWKVR